MIGDFSQFNTSLLRGARQCDNWELQRFKNVLNIIVNYFLEFFVLFSHAICYKREFDWQVEPVNVVQVPEPRRIKIVNPPAVHVYGFHLIVLGREGVGKTSNTQVGAKGDVVLPCGFEYSGPVI
jgi:hypothetical protein